MALVILFYVAAETVFPKQVRQIGTGIQNLLSQAKDIRIDGKPVKQEPSLQPEDPLPLPPPPLINPMRGLIVQSNPSGAEIYLNGKNTNKLTPARVNVPTDRNFEIVLRKPRYVDYEGSNLKADSIGTSWTASLQKARVAYLNIDVRPSRNVEVYVNGQKLSENLPVTGYSIPANQLVDVKAVNKLTGQKVTQKVRLYEDQRKELILQLDKNRRPSSQR